jgi:formylglycine-generating enzyme required for sulfatase activity
MYRIASISAITAAGLALVLGLSPASPAAARSYTFRNVADNTGPYSSFWIPAINDAGTVVFRAGRDAGGEGIFTGPDPVADAVATTDGPYSAFGSNSLPAINSAGTVAFVAIRDAGGGGIFTGPDPVADAVATTDGPYVAFDVATTINDAGTVAFRAGLDGGGFGIFTGPDPVADAVATSDGLYADLSAPAINDAGTVVFWARRDAGGQGIFTGPDPVADAVVTTDGPYSSFSVETAINGAGTVAFIANLDTGGQGIFTGPDPVADAVAMTDTLGGYTGFFDVEINDSGTIAFLARIASGSRLGIYTGSDLFADRVIVEGAQLFGSIVTDLDFFRGLNNSGDIAFRYALLDGREGIAVASAIPEPSTLLLGAVAGIGLFWRRRGLLCASVVGAAFSVSLTGQAIADTFGSGANTFDIDFVSIGNPGNAADSTGSPNPSGSVPYRYRIGKFEISEEMIERASVLGGLGIATSNRGPNKPATNVTWYEAARFVNWLNVSTGSPPAYKFAIQPGDVDYVNAGSHINELWTPSDAGYNPNNLFRNSLAQYFLPSVDEWYKAAFYNPISGAYLDYPTASNSAPDGIDFAGDPDFDAVFDDGVDGGHNSQPNDITNVGVLGPYGVAAMGGNVEEWEETEADLLNDMPYSHHGIRGGNWTSNFTLLRSSERYASGGLVTTSSPFLGFRVASFVPEPSAILLFVTSALCLTATRRRTWSGTRFAVIAIVVSSNLPSVAHAVTIETVPVGNPGNAPDTRYIDSFHPNGVGAVGYDFRVGKTEITNAQYVSFLNAVAASDHFELYNADMGSSSYGGIVRNGTPGNYSYSIKAAALAGTYAYDHKPVLFVDSGDAMRFANWLHNDQPTGAQDANTTENGAYALNGATSNAALAAVSRNSGARWWLPNEDEWYKAAYYSSGTQTYYDFPTHTNSVPNNNQPSSDTGNSANFYNSGYTTGNSIYPLTDAGDYELSPSPYGTFDQGGNAWEWNETPFIGSFTTRGIRGGWAHTSSNSMRASAWDSFSPALDTLIGFRVARIAVPEPSTLLLGGLAGVGLLWRRRSLCVALLVTTVATSSASAQTIEWTRQLGTSVHDISNGVSADGLGNVYISGYTDGSLGGPSALSSDAFVSKFDAAGALQWSRQLGTVSNDQSQAVSADGLGNVYISGFSRGSLGGPSAGLNDAFISKYDASGAVQWTRQLGTTAFDESRGVSADGLGGIYISGVTGGSLDGPSAGDNDAFVAKYDAAGALLWSRQLGTSGSDASEGVSADGLGNLYIGGWTRGSLGGPNAGIFDAFISKYDEAGALQWTRQLGTSSEDVGYGVSADGLGNVYLSGYTRGSLDGPNAGSNDAFVAKYDADGALLWLRQFGTASLDISYGVSADALGSVYLSGYTVGSLGGTSAGLQDAFVTKFNAAGDLLWSTQVGTSADDYSHSVSADGLGNVYFSGPTRGNLAGQNVGGAHDAFVSRIADIPEPSTLLLGALASVGLLVRRRRWPLSLAIFTLAVIPSASTVWAVTIDMVTVGNPGNAPDTEVMTCCSTWTGTSGYGSVGYVYRIGKYEVTAGQYTAFLNAVAKDDPNRLYDTLMDNPEDPYNGANIQRSGSSPNFSYSVTADWADRPVNYVSFWDAARFVNWLHNGQPTGAQGPGTTEDGAYHDVGNQMLFGRNAGARFFIPTEDEWYKAAYHDKSAGLAASYFDYPTRTDAVPGRDIDENTNPGNNANYYLDGYMIGSPYYRTAVGEFQLSAGSYGTFDQGGNVWEWNETAISGAWRVARGGSSGYPLYAMHASHRSNSQPVFRSKSTGFRIASALIPEPSSILLLGCALIGGLGVRRRFSKSSWLLLVAAITSLSCALLVSPASAMPLYDIVRLGLTDPEHTDDDGNQYGDVSFINEAGHVIGVSYRYEGGSINLGYSPWIYDGMTITKVGLTGPEHTRNDGYKSSFIQRLNSAGQVAGTSERYLGNSALMGGNAWFYDGQSTFTIGLTGEAHSRNDGYQSSIVLEMNEAGHVLGSSALFNGGTEPLGSSGWVYNGSSTIEIGPTDNEHTSSDGYRSSELRGLNEVGQVAGYSVRYSGVTSMGTSAWFYDGATTHKIGLVGPEHTRNDDYKESAAILFNDTGHVAGFSNRYDSGNVQKGSSAWRYNGTTTINIGLVDVEHTRDDGHKESLAQFMNDAGQVLGHSKRYNGGSADLGQTVWLYDGTTTVNIGLVGPDYTRHDGARVSYIGLMNQAGQAIGNSENFAAGQIDTWFYDGATTAAIGLTGVEHTRADGYRENSSLYLTESGKVIGYASRYNGGPDQLGLTNWIYDGASVVPIGLTGPEYTNADGRRDGYVSAFDGAPFNEAGQVIGYSTVYSSGFEAGRGAWLFDGVSTVDIAPTGSIYVGTDGFKYSEPFRINSAGQVIGHSNRLNAETSLGDITWFYDPALQQTFEFVLSTSSDGLAYSSVYYFGEDGMVLGTYDLFDEMDNFVGSRAFYFTVAEGLHDLGSLVDGGLNANGWESLAIAIRGNGLGQIIGSGGLISLASQPFLLKPIEAELPGDFNHDGSVDAADYVAWRKGLGTIYTQDDYNDWLANFGVTLGSGAGGNGSDHATSPIVPEPATVYLLVFGATVMCSSARQFREELR